MGKRASQRQQKSDLLDSVQLNLYEDDDEKKREEEDRPKGSFNIRSLLGTNELDDRK